MILEREVSEEVGALFVVPRGNVEELGEGTLWMCRVEAKQSEMYDHFRSF